MSEKEFHSLFNNMEEAGREKFLASVRKERRRYRILLEFIFKLIMLFYRSTTKQIDLTLLNVAPLEDSVSKSHLDKLRATLTDMLDGIHLSACDSTGPDESLFKSLGNTIDKLSESQETLRVCKKEIIELQHNFQNHPLTTELHFTKQENNRLGVHLQQTQKNYDIIVEQLATANEHLASFNKTTTSVALQVDENDIHLSTGFDQDRVLVVAGLLPYLNKDVTSLRTIMLQSKLTKPMLKKHMDKQRKLPTVEQTCMTIAGIYQAKLYQDIQDCNGKRLEPLSTFVRDVYTLQYGLKALAMNQLGVLDTVVKRYAGSSSRIRLFGLLVGSMEPDSWARSSEAIDFFLFLVGILFKVGHYERNREHAVSVAKRLKVLLGDGCDPLPGNEIAATTTMIPIGKAIEAAETAFALCSDRLKPLLQNLEDCGASSHGSIAIDYLLELLMIHWFNVHKWEVEMITRALHQWHPRANEAVNLVQFTTLISKFDSDISSSETLSFFNRVLMADDSIDMNAFVNEIISHQQKISLLGRSEKKNRRKSVLSMPDSTSSSTGFALLTVVRLTGLASRAREGIAQRQSTTYTQNRRSSTFFADNTDMLKDMLQLPQTVDEEYSSSEDGSEGEEEEERENWTE